MLRVNAARLKIIFFAASTRDVESRTATEINVSGEAARLRQPSVQPAGGRTGGIVVSLGRWDRLDRGPGPSAAMDEISHLEDGSRAMASSQQTMSFGELILVEQTSEQTPPVRSYISVWLAMAVPIGFPLIGRVIDLSRSRLMDWIGWKPEIDQWSVDILSLLIMPRDLLINRLYTGYSNADMLILIGARASPAIYSIG